MDKEELLKLPPVLFAPFLAAGALIAYFGGSFAGGLTFAAAAAFSIIFAKKLKNAVICSAGTAIGSAAMLVYMMSYSIPVTGYAGQTVTTTVKVTDITDNSGDTQQFVGEMMLGAISARVDLSSECSVEVGDVATAVVDLEQTDKENEVRDLANGIFLSGNVAVFLDIEKQTDEISYFFQQIRNGMISRLSEELFGEERQLALSMFFGEDSELSQTLSERIRISGVSHFTAVSGAHFAVLASVILRFFPNKNRRARALFSFFITPCAVFFFGFTLSVMRSSLMFLIMSVAPLFKRESDPLNSLCIAVCIILITMPQAVLDIGFAMSVLGVFGAGIAGPAIAEKLCELLPEKAKFVSAAITAFMSSFCAVICTAPISAAAFKGLSLNAVVASILIMPLLTIGMTFMLLLGLTGAGIFAIPIELSVKLIIMIVNLFGSERRAFMGLNFFGAWVLAAICAILAAMAALGNMKMLWRSCAITAVVAVLCTAVSFGINENRKEIRFVGNSTTSAAVVLCGEKADVYIAGSGVGIADDISRCMRENGAYEINMLAALDSDFSGELALTELLQLTDIESVVLSENISGIPARLVSENSTFCVNGMTIASAKASDSETSADIVLYHGTITKPPQTSAELAIYFTNTSYELPKNSVNIYRNRDHCIKLNGNAIVELRP